uniref:Secreted protein n=1 Tax=Panagrellus redivivus TaxID=6233 RepID=A0A7E4VAX0_PANRE
MPNSHRTFFYAFSSLVPQDIDDNATPRSAVSDAVNNKQPWRQSFFVVFSSPLRGFASPFIYCPLELTQVTPRQIVVEVMRVLRHPVTRVKPLIG